MANPAQAVFALTLAIWVADVRFAPQHAAPQAAAEASCQSGPSSTPPADADLEVVVCAPQLR
jgi:hypothetical protein